MNRVAEAPIVIFESPTDYGMDFRRHRDVYRNGGLVCAYRAGKRREERNRFVVIPVEITS